jgi:hypothetical protein
MTATPLHTRITTINAKLAQGIYKAKEYQLTKNIFKLV